MNTLIKTLAVIATGALLATSAYAQSAATAVNAQDKYTLRVPDGLAFSDFKGYEDWQLISSSKTDDRLKVILGNPTIIAAYKSGVPGNGKPFPAGSKIAKVQWKRWQTFFSWKRIARNFRPPADGHTRSLTMTRRRPLSRPTKAAQ